MYKFFLTGRKFLVKTDNLAFSWFKTQKDPKGILIRLLRILSTYEFDIQHGGGTKHGNADSLSHASHTPFLSKPEAAEVLVDDHILSLSKDLLDDGQESEENYDSLDESDSETDAQLPAQDEVPVPQGTQQKTLAEKQQTDPVLSKIRQWIKNQHKPTSQEYKLLSPDEKFFVDCFEYFQLDSDGALIRQSIPYTYKKDCRIPFLENLQERVLAEGTTNKSEKKKERNKSEKSNE